MPRAYITLSAIIFALVALAHLLRLWLALPVEVGSTAIPMGLSWLGLVAGAILAVWGFSSLRN